MMSLSKSLAKLIFAQYVLKSSQHPIKSHFSASTLILFALDSADTFRRSTFLSTTLGVCGKKDLLSLFEILDNDVIGLTGNFTNLFCINKISFVYYLDPRPRKCHIMHLKLTEVNIFTKDIL